MQARFLPTRRIDSLLEGWFAAGVSACSRSNFACSSRSPNPVWGLQFHRRCTLPDARRSTSNYNHLKLTADASLSEFCRLMESDDKPTQKTVERRCSQASDDADSRHGHL